MTRVERFQGLKTNIDKLHEAIKKEIEHEKNLRIVSEIRGEMNGKPLRALTAVNKSPVVLAGALREITISIVGGSEDYAVEVASGAWFDSLIFPAITGFVVGGPLGAVGGTTVGLIMAYQFERKIWKKIREVIEKESENSLSVNSVEQYGK